MKAVRVDELGGVDRLQFVDVKPPTPRAAEVVLEIRACGLNYSDVLKREGLYPRGPRPPFTPGVEATGIVVERGSDVSGLELGARVMGMADEGLHAERAVVDARSCLALPKGLDLISGAAFPVSYLTACHGLIGLARVREDECLVVHAAGGGLGTAVVQIGKLLGLRVIALASTAAKREKLEALGVAQAVDYPKLEDAVRDVTSGVGADVVFATVGGSIFQRSLKSLAPFGRAVLAGMLGGAASIDPTRMLFGSQQVLGLHLSNLVRNPDAFRETYERLVHWLEGGALSVQIGHELPLAEVRAAHELLESRKSFGKVVLVP